MRYYAPAEESERRRRAGLEIVAILVVLAIVLLVSPSPMESRQGPRDSPPPASPAIIGLQLDPHPLMPPLTASRRSR